MTVRARAQQRLDRSVPEARHTELRALSRRLVERSEEAAVRPVVGAKLRRPSESVRGMRLKNPAQPSPNAPLLMRIVRTPFALEGVRFVRQRLIEPTVVVEREARARAGSELREALSEVATRNPMRSPDHRPAHRPHPFARAREGAP